MERRAREGDGEPEVSLFIDPGHDRPINRNNNLARGDDRLIGLTFMGMVHGAWGRPRQGTHCVEVEAISFQKENV